MATENQHTVPQCVRDALRARGYEYDDTMQSLVAEWWEWYTASVDWYDKTETVNGRKFTTRRHTLHPARRVCREWASSILDDDGTKIAASDETASELLSEWVKNRKFIPTAQRALERAFGVGTSALALWFEVRDDGADIKVRRYDARTMLPLTWDDDGITECAFVTDSYVDGRKVHQAQLHTVGETGTYHVETLLWDARENVPITSDSIIGDFDTGSDTPTFAILRPALDNVYAEGTYMGQSVYADAIDAIKGVDNAFDSMQREIDATKVKIFMSEDLFDIEDRNGKKVAVPMSPEQTIVVKMGSTPGNDMYQVFSPPIRIQQLAEALNVALSELGDLTGFGQDYFRYDRKGGIRTATEVSADNNGFMRTIRKHENELRPQLEQLLTSVMKCHVALGEWAGVPAEAEATVDFDDSIIQDTTAEKGIMLQEVAAGIVPKWKYLVRFYAMSEEDAREEAGDPEVIDMGA